MSIYKSSSLAMIPSAYKDGKLYSVRPTDGSGDFTFSRGSNLAATRVASSGYIEKGRENVLLNSVWDGIGTNVPPTSWTNGFTSGNYESASSSFGGNNGIRFYGTSARRYVSQIPSFSGIMALSIYVESVTTADEIRYVLNQIGGTELFYLEDSSVVANTTSILAGKTYTLVFNTSGTTEIRIGGGVTGSRTYDFTLSVPQLEQGLVRTDYIETGASTAQAGILEDMPRLDYSGGATCPSLLLEPQRTNMFTQSEYFDSWVLGGITQPTLTANYSQSPEGLQNAYRVQLPNIATDSLMAQIVSHTSGTDMTISAWVKSASGSNEVFKLYGDYGTPTGRSSQFTATSEWQRFTFTFTPTATGSRGTGLLSINNTASDLLVYGMQIEAASYPTSYIPTYGSSVTRSKDFVSLTSASDLMDVNGTTFLLEVQGISNGGDSRRFSISDGTYNNRAVIELDETADTIKVFLVGNGSVGASLTITGIDQTNNNKIAVAFDSSGVIVYINGEYKTQDTSITLPTALSEIKFRDGGGSNLEMEGYVKQAIVFSSRLTDTELASLTTL